MPVPPGAGTTQPSPKIGLWDELRAELERVGLMRQKETVGELTDEEAAKLRDLELTRSGLDGSLALAMSVHAQKIGQLQACLNDIFDAIASRLALPPSEHRLLANHRTKEIWRG